jgi:hypothetical protein
LIGSECVVLLEELIHGIRGPAPGLIAKRLPHPRVLNDQIASHVHQRGVRSQLGEDVVPGVKRIEDHQGPSSRDALLHLRHCRGIYGAAHKKVHLALDDRELSGIPCIVCDVDGDHAPCRVDLLEDHGPQRGAAALEGPRFDYEVRANLVEELLGDPSVQRVLDGLNPEPTIPVEMALLLPPPVREPLDFLLAQRL